MGKECEELMSHSLFTQLYSSKTIWNVYVI